MAVKMMKMKMMMMCCQTQQQLRDDVNRLTSDLDSSISEADLLQTDKVDSLIHSFIYSFIHSLIHSLTHSFIHSLIHSVIAVCLVFSC